jgi:diguanylate cyclase (GGDEF)-like protein
MSDQEPKKLPRLYIEDDVDPRQIETRLLEPARILSAGRTREPWLVILSGPRSSGRMHRIRSGMTIGRSIGSDILIEEPGVSRRHAVTRILATGQILLEDVGSSNGTYRGNERVSRVVLSDGDRVSLGDVLVSVLLLEEHDSESLARLELIDAATRLPNRRALLSTLKEAIDYSARYDSTFSLCLLLIDQWREVHDDLGPDVAHAVVSHIAAIARNVLQSEEASIARTSEDEIGLVLPDMDASQAARCAECIRRAVDASPLQPAASSPRIHVTISGGLAPWARGSQSLNVADLVAQAQHQLYRAILAGRNCIEPDGLSSSRPPPGPLAEAQKG